MSKAIIEQVSKSIGEMITPHIHLLLNLKPDLRELPVPTPGHWVGFIGERVTSQSELIDFVGVIDLETTGLDHHADVTHAVAIGTIGLDKCSLIWVPVNPTDRLPVFNSMIANWNQPFDRKYYSIIGGVDTNTHLDLMGLALAVRGKPDKWKMKTGKFQTWEPYVLPNMKLKTALKSYVGLDIDKSTRDQIILGTASSESIARYCWEDVNHTIMVTPIVLAEYLAMAPNPLSIWGHIMRHKFVLPISDKWDGYYDRVEVWYNAQKDYQASVLWEQLMIATYSDYPAHQCLRAQFPETYKLKIKKLPTLFTTNQFWLLNLQTRLLPLLVLTQMTELPKWFADILFTGWKTSSAPIVLIMQLSWDGSAILYDRANRDWYHMVEGHRSILPNEGDDSKKLQTPLCKDYQEFINSGTLQSNNLPDKFRASMKNCIRWTMFRGRVGGLALTPDGYLIPEYSPTGTLSCRASDKVSLLIGSPKFDYGGSEFMSMIEAKPGYLIVSADLDSAELVLAGAIGCFYEGVTEEDGIDFTRANLYGSKEAKTDTHTLTSISCGITREDAKILNYGGQYGQGHATRTKAIQKMAKVSATEAEKISHKFKESFIDGLAAPYFRGVRLLTEHRSPTLLLGRKMPMAYQKASPKEGVTSIVNHNTQSLGVDWLDCLQALVWYRLPTVQLILTRHDELIYHCPSDQVGELTEVLQWAHRASKAALLELIGVTSGPEAWMQFSSVDSNIRYLKSLDHCPDTVTTTF